MKDKTGKTVQKIVLAEVCDNDRIGINVPVVLLVPKQVHNSEMLVARNSRFVRVRGKVSDIPRQFRVNLSGRDAPTRVTAADVDVPNYLELITDENEVLYVLSLPTRTN